MYRFPKNPPHRSIFKEHPKVASSNEGLSGTVKFVLLSLYLQDVHPDLQGANW